ncbi:MAG: hypothetical protein WAK57_04905, partial [Desulfobacterales bacterium]
MQNLTKVSPTTSQPVQALKIKPTGRPSLQEISDRIYNAANLEEILIDLKDDITALFGAERLSVYVIDGVKRELV